MNYFSSNFKLGILGGGQLGKMLLAETRKFDIQTYVLEPSKEAPCRFIAKDFIIGDLMDFETVYNFGKLVNLLTIEIENVNIDALEKLEKEGLAVYRSSKTLRLIQNKGIQKKFYQENNIPTSTFETFSSLENLKLAIVDQKSKIKFPFVWKCTQFGYDGNGVKIVRSISDMENLPNVECIAEEIIAFKKELAVIVSRSVSGEIKTYPVVEMEFHPEANQVEYVICPARIEDKIAKKANAVALKVSETFNAIALAFSATFSSILAGQITYST
jgi:5-(carboxyamino)imidazole ribonucleotide synthase